MDGLDSTDHLLTVAEAARFAGVSEKTIYRALDARRLKHARMGQRKGYRLRKEWVDDWVESCAVDVDPVFAPDDFKHMSKPEATARSGPYAQRQTPRRGFLK